MSIKNNITPKFILENTKDFNEFDLYLGQFLDDFYNSDNKLERELIIAEEPADSGDNIKNRIMAAIVDELCFRYELKVPEWVSKDNFIKGEPIFYHGGLVKEDYYKVILMLEAPITFAIRDVFVPRQFLVRF